MRRIGLFSFLVLVADGCTIDFGKYTFAAEETPASEFVEEGDTGSPVGSDDAGADNADADDGQASSAEAGADAGGDACATANGGCDPLVSCRLPPGSGARICGTCPNGYVSSPDARCVPTLTGLTVGSTAGMAVLQPTLNSSDIEYSTVVPFMEQTLTLVPMVPEGGRVTIDGTPVPSGTPWQSPRLALGVNFLTIVVSQSGQPSRTYRLRVDVSPG